MSQVSRFLKGALDKIHLLETCQENSITEDKILLNRDDKLVISKCKEFLDYIYSVKFLNKKSMRQIVKDKFNLTSEVRSIFGNEYFSVRFSQNTYKDETFSGDIRAATVLAINKVINWSDKPLFNVVLNTVSGKSTVWLINLTNIQYISGPNYARNGSEKFNSPDNMTGSINGGDITGEKVTSTNFETLWVEQCKSDINANKERIFNSTIERNNRLKSKRKKYILDYNKLNENIDNTIAYMQSSQYKTAKAKLDSGAQLAYDNRDKILEYDNGNIICAITEHIIRSRDLNVINNTRLLNKDQNIADIIIGDAFIDIKVHYKDHKFYSIGGGKLMSLEKLINDINTNPNKVHLFYNYNLLNNEAYLVNVFDSSLIDNYSVTTAWTGAGGLGHLTCRDTYESGKIDKEKIFEFFHKILGY